MAKVMQKGDFRPPTAAKPLNRFLTRDAMHKRSLCRHAVSVRPSVCPSVTFVDHVRTNKHIFDFFSKSGSHCHAILVFPYQTGWRYSEGTRLTWASNTGGVGNKRDSG